MDTDIIMFKIFQSYNIFSLKELDLTLKQIQTYFEGDSDFRTKILHDNFITLLKRDRLNDIICNVRTSFSQR